MNNVYVFKLFVCKSVEQSCELKLNVCIHFEMIKLQAIYLEIGWYKALYEEAGALTIFTALEVII